MGVGSLGFWKKPGEATANGHVTKPFISWDGENKPPTDQCRVLPMYWYILSLLYCHGFQLVVAEGVVSHLFTHKNQGFKSPPIHIASFKCPAVAYYRAPPNFFIFLPKGTNFKSKPNLSYCICPTQVVFVLRAPTCCLPTKVVFLLRAPTCCLPTKVVFLLRAPTCCLPTKVVFLLRAPTRFSLGPTKIALESRPGARSGCAPRPLSFGGLHGESQRREAERIASENHARGSQAVQPHRRFQEIPAGCESACFFFFLIWSRYTSHPFSPHFDGVGTLVTPF